MPRMSLEQLTLEQIQLCAKKCLTLLADYEVIHGPLVVGADYTALEDIETQAAVKITAIDKQTGLVSPGEKVLYVNR